MSEIVTVAEKKHEKFLRQKTVDFDFSNYSAKEIRELVRRMRDVMHKAQGIGLSANQIGLTCRVFVAHVPDGEGKLKFYAVFNPQLSRPSKETEELEEGCLSVPEKWGLVERHYRVMLTGKDYRNKPLKIKAWGLLARVFQHEVDHLDGKLFIDRAKEVHEAPKSDRLKAREEKLKE